MFIRDFLGWSVNSFDSIQISQIFHSWKQGSTNQQSRIISK